MEIKFEKMYLSLDERRVFIVGENKLVSIEISILLLADLLDTDKVIVKKVRNNFGSKELELQIVEAKDMVNRFPHISNLKNCLELDILEINEKEDVAIIIAESSLCGWEGENISITLPLRQFAKISKKNFSITLKPCSILFMN